MPRIVLALVGALSLGSALQDFAPARYRSGSVPPIPPQAVGGGEVLLEARVDATGEVRGLTTLRATPPYTDLLERAASGWRFDPAQVYDHQRESLVTDESTVLIAGAFRPPSLYPSRTVGEVPKDVSAPSPETPYPTSVVMPNYPPDAIGDRAVLVEIEVTPTGTVREARVVQSAPGFDAAALDAARRWSFRPARRDGVAVPSLAYIVFGFRQPVVPPPRD